MSGKNKCKILKEIRQNIADANEIPFVTAECKYQGNCKGTCPKCEEEVAYLENELKKRQQAGKKIAVAGLATTALLLSLNGCGITDSIKEKIEGSMTQGIVPRDFPYVEQND